MIFRSHPPSKMMTLSKHDKHEQKHGIHSKSETCGCPKVGQNQVEKIQKNKKIEHPTQIEKKGAIRRLRTPKPTLVWPQGSLGRDNSTRPQHIKPQD